MWIERHLTAVNIPGQIAGLAKQDSQSETLDS